MAVATGGAEGSAKASQREIDWDQLDVKRFLVLGVASFSAVTTVLYPLTVVKTVQQAASEPLSTAQTVAAVWRSGGVLAFYRGWSTVVIGTIPARVISLTSLEATKSAVTKWGRQLGTPDTALSGTANFAAGGVSSLVTQLITVPRDVVSQRQMVEDGRRPGCASKLQAEARAAAATAAGAGAEAGAGAQGVKGGLAGMGGRAAEAWPVHRSSGAGQSLGAEAAPKPVPGGTSASATVSGIAGQAAAPSASSASASATVSGAAAPAAQLQQQAGAGGSGGRDGGAKPLQASSSGRPAGDGDGGRSGGKASRAASSLHGQYGQGSQRLAHIASKAVNVATAGLHLNGSPPSQPHGQASLTAPSRNSAPSSLSPSPAAAARAHSAAVGSGHSSAKGATMSAGGSGFRAASSWSPAGGPEAPRPFPSTGTLQMVRCIVREEGVAGLYRGFGISVASTVPTSAVWWGSYGLFQQLLWDVLPTLRSSSPVSSNSISNSNAQSTPGVQHSAQQQLQPGVTEQPIQAAVRWLRGITASRTAPTVPTGVAAPDSPVNPSPTPNTHASTSLAARSLTVLSSTPPSGSGGADVIAVQTLASLLAGVTSAAVTTPLDLVKTRVQVARKADGQANTFRAIASQILRDEGLRGMFRGSGPRIVSSAAWGCAMVTVYEWVKRTSHIADH